MTIWLSKNQVKQEFQPIINGSFSISIDTELSDSDRIRISAICEGDVTIDSREMYNLKSFLESIGDGNPELQIQSVNSKLHISIEADENVYQEGF